MERGTDMPNLIETVLTFYSQPEQAAAHFMVGRDYIAAVYVPSPAAQAFELIEAGHSLRDWRGWRGEEFVESGYYVITRVDGELHWQKQATFAVAVDTVEGKVHDIKTYASDAMRTFAH